MGLQSDSIFDQRVYAQDTQPTDERDGNLWADTTSDPPTLNVYSESSGAWEPASASSFDIQSTEPSNPVLGDGWIDTSLSNPVPRIWNGTKWSYAGRGFAKFTDISEYEFGTFTEGSDQEVFFDGTEYATNSIGFDTVRSVSYDIGEYEAFAVRFEARNTDAGNQTGEARVRDATTSTTVTTANLDSVGTFTEFTAIGLARTSSRTGTIDIRFQAKSGGAENVELRDLSLYRPLYGEEV